MTNPFEVDEYIYSAPIIYIEEAFYVFGGFGDGHSLQRIGKLDASINWSQVGDLYQRRLSHNVIYDGKYALVVGGDEGRFYTERCRLSIERFYCVGQEPELSEYDNPALFLVSFNYCKKQTAKFVKK